VDLKKECAGIAKKNVSVAFEPADGTGRFRIVASPHLGVFEIRLRLRGELSESIYKGLSEFAVAELQLALDEVIGVLGIEAPVVLVEHPAWHKVACGIPGATVVYDCLDLATGFSNVANSLAAAEAAMLRTADLVITASQPLADYVAQQRTSILIRNAAEVDFMGAGFADRTVREHPVIGYFGAIAEWFEIEWIERCAAARPDWEFRLIGRTVGCDISRAANLANVRFYGEMPYHELPAALREFDVAIIPFKIIELTRCTNPVKLYEYMAAGKPVVSAPIPEVIEATDLAYIADDAGSFAERIEEALAEDTSELRARRQAWAREHSWASRVRQLTLALDASFPLVSVVILAYNNWDYTKACIFSIRSWSDYPNLEIIVVDNASTDGSPGKLRELEPQDERVRVILHDANLGVAGGYNAGLRAARGEYVVLLNNDTFVTRGWVRDLIRPMQLDPRVGMVGPLTNSIGNEQKISIAYADMQEMQRAARRRTRWQLRRTFEIQTLAFFCVAIRRGVIEEIGLLDEVYGIGYFEDDDYCRRASQANYKLVVADDVFVHHYHSVSFGALGEKAAEQMARNRAIFEERWGAWTPHRYRDEPGFAD
jgi:GT2 family glycosyltransferase/glycosyltransferase involved in cell wall biosynthesis